MSRSDPPAATKPEVALGYSVVVNLDGNRQMTVQCFVGEGESDDVVNAKLDRVFRVVDRQKARYDIVAEHDELRKEQETLAQLEEDLARIEGDFQRAQASLETQMEEMQTQAKETFEAGYNEHVASGRRGEYQPRGTVQQQTRAIELAIQNAKEAHDKNAAERDQHLQGVMISIERYKKAITERTANIAKLEAALG